MIEELLKSPRSFDYFQALRLLFLESGTSYSSLSDLINRGLDIQAATELDFPSSELTEIQPKEAGGFDLTVTFMGLCGACSPLPPFYAQEIRDDVLNDDPGSRQLINLISLPSYRHQARAYFHNQLPFRLLEENDQFCWKLISCLLGLGHESLRKQAPGSGGDLGFLSLLAGQSRTADGLLAYLGGRFRLERLEITQCVQRWVSIPEGQRCVLGGDARYRQLGACVAGRRVRDQNGRFDLTVPVGDRDLLDRLRPGEPLRKDLEDAADRFLSSPLVYSINFVLARGAAAGVRLGQAKGLGRWDCLAPPADREMLLISPASGSRGPQYPAEDLG
jgi:type VI secretion system protein ImpH